MTQEQEAELDTVVSVCGFEPQSIIHCDVVAVNSAGSSPAASVSTITRFQSKLALTFCHF